jgi:hypothetical protein
MKRNFLIRAFVCLFTVVALCSCSKDDDEENDNGENGVIRNNTLIAAVEYGATYNENIDVVKANIEYEYFKEKEYTLASAPYENGGFTLHLPESIDPRYLHSYFEGYLSDYYSFEEGVPQGLTVSNLNAKICYVYLDAYKSDTWVGDFIHGTDDYDAEDGLIYSDSDCNITGSTTYEGYNGYTMKDTYDVYLKKGWNMIYSGGYYQTPYELTVTTQVPVGATWRYERMSPPPSMVFIP